MRFLIIDIGSESVGAAGVEVQKGVPVMPTDRQARIVFVERAPIPLASELQPAHFFSATAHALEQVCARIRTPVTRVHLFLHSPWVVSKTRAWRAEFPTTTLLTEKVLATAVQEAERGIEENFRAAYKEVASAVRRVERALVEFRVNGYSVASACGKEARTLEFSLLESFAPENALVKFNSLVERVTAAPRVWGAGAAAIALAPRVAMGDYTDVLTVVAGGEAIELALVRAGAPSAILSVPVSLRTLARDMYRSGALSSVSTAEAFLIAPESALAALAPARRAQVERARTEAYARIAQAVREALAPYERDGARFTSVFVFSPEKYAAFFMRALAPFNPVIPDTGAFAGKIEWRVRESVDPVFLAETAFVFGCK